MVSTVVSDPAKFMQESSESNLVQTYQAFPSKFGSIMLSTVSPKGFPQASYAPCVVDDARNIYIFVSGLSAHTQNLSTSPRASVLFIEDEADSPQIFARKRLSYDCTAELLPREAAEWTAIAQQFSAKFGEIVDVMIGLPDFRIFQLQPYAGRFVMGFGQAYDVDPDNLNRLIHKKGR